MWFVYRLTRPYEEYEFNWTQELKQIRQDERAHWIIMIIKLVSQVKTKVLSYINLIMKTREKDFHDEHENMFDMI